MKIASIRILLYVIENGQIFIPLFLRVGSAETSPALWEIMGGAYEDADFNLTRTAIREALEEAGLIYGGIIEVKPFLLYTRPLIEGNGEFRIYVTLWRRSERPKIEVNHREHCLHLWVTPEDALRMMPLTEATRRILLAFLRRVQ